MLFLIKGGTGLPLCLCDKLSLLNAIFKIQAFLSIPVATTDISSVYLGRLGHFELAPLRTDYPQECFHREL